MRPRYQDPGSWLRVFAASAFLLLHTFDAGAVNVSMDVIPSVRLEQGWESNRFNASTGETSDFFFRARPELALRWNTPGAGIRLSGSVEETWYYNHTEANQDPTWNFSLGLTGGQAVQITLAVSVIPSAYYINTVNSSRRTQLLPSGDAVVPPVTTATYANTKVQDFGGGLGLNYLATPNLSFGLNGNYGERRFSGDNTAPLSNSTTVGGAASVSYLFTPRFSGGLDVAGSHNTFENNPSSDVLSAGIHFGYQFNPAFRVDGKGGASRVRQEGRLGIPAQDVTGFSGRFNASYLKGTLTANIYASKEYSGGSGFGGITRQETFGLGLLNQLDKGWSWSLGGSYQRNRSVFVDTVDLNTANGTAGLRYQPWEWGSLDLTGNAIRQMSDGNFGTNQNSYTGLLGITLGKPYNVF